MNIRPSFALPAALLLLPSCGADAPDAPEVVLRDSAGITIVENRAPEWEQGEAWTVADTPTLDIGVLEGDPHYQLFQVTSAVRLDDGRIVVANAGTHELRFYSTAGKYLTSAGGKGSGPGEFGEAVRVWRFRGDSLITWDRGNRRFSVFDARGNFVRSFRLANGESGFHLPLDVFGGGSVLAQAGEVLHPRDVKTGPRNDSDLYLLFDAEGVLLDTVGRFPGDQSFMYKMGRGFSIVPVPFGREPQRAVHGQRLYFSRTDSYEIGIYSERGELRRIIRKDHRSPEVTSEAIERYEVEVLAGIENEGGRRHYRRVFAEISSHPETMPAFSDLLVDGTGNLWVKEYVRPGDEQPQWTVFDPEGRLLGTVETPASLRITQIGPDYLLGVWTDQFGVQHVRLYELKKPTQM